MRNVVMRASAAGLMVAGLAGGANAGGLEASGYNWDLLFDPAPYAARANGTFVRVDQDVRNGAGDVVSTTPDTWRYQAGVKGSFEDISCLVSTTNPFGTGVDRDQTQAALTGRAVSEQLTSNDTGLTCAYGFALGAGTLSVIGGASYQTLDYEAVIPTGLATSAPLELSGNGVGWRAGVAYEIPEIALRVSAIYNAAIDYDLDGSFGVINPASAEATVPQSFEVKGQTGIAPGWAATGAIKWVDWSVLQSLDVSVNGTPAISSEFLYRDGVTISAGVAHVLNDQLTLAGGLTYDRGTATKNDAGVLLAGTQTDRYGINVGAVFTPIDGLEVTGGLSLSQLQAGSNVLGESWDRSNVFGASLAVKGSF